MSGFRAVHASNLVLLTCRVSRTVGSRRAELPNAVILMFGIELLVNRNALFIRSC